FTASSATRAFAAAVSAGSGGRGGRDMIRISIADFDKARVEAAAFRSLPRYNLVTGGWLGYRPNRRAQLTGRLCHLQAMAERRDTRGFADEARYPSKIPLYKSGHDRRNRILDPLDLWGRGRDLAPRHRSEDPSSLDRRLAASGRPRRAPFALQLAIRKSELCQRQEIIPAPLGTCNLCLTRAAKLLSQPQPRRSRSATWQSGGLAAKRRTRGAASSVRVKGFACRLDLS